VLVRDLVRESVDGLCAFGLSLVAELSTVSAETVSQATLVRRHRAVVLVVIDGQGLQSVASAHFGLSPCCLDYLLEVVAKVCG